MFPNMAPYEVNRSTNIIDEYCERGRELVERGELFPISQSDNLALIAYWQRQRSTVVVTTGKCSGGCVNVKQVLHPQGRMVCPHTWQVCPHVRGSRGKDIVDQQ
jgi:hypothetical protein